MTATEFKEVMAGIESIAIVLATFLGGGWALYQFFTLRAREKSDLQVAKANKELDERSVLKIELRTESFQIDRSFALHVQVVIQNVGNGVDAIDWAKAKMFAMRYNKTDANTLKSSGQKLMAQREPSFAIGGMRFAPGYITSESFLIPIPEAGVYYIEFIVPVSAIVMKATLDAIEIPINTEVPSGEVYWRADKFVAIEQAQSGKAS